MSVVGIPKGLGEAKDQVLEEPALLCSREFCKPVKQVQGVKRNQRSIWVKLSEVGVAVPHAGVSGQELKPGVCARAGAFVAHVTLSMPKRCSAGLQNVLKMCKMSGCRLNFERYALRQACVHTNTAPELLFRLPRYGGARRRRIATSRKLTLSTST